MQHRYNGEFWADCHLSPVIAKWMNEATGYVFKSAYSLKLYELTDVEIYELAKKKANLILISKDSDFPYLIYRYGTPPKLINLKIGNTHNKILYKFLGRKRPYCRFRILIFFTIFLP